MKKITFWILALILLFVYIYFRTNPILNETVPYTYDQGRDFLKVQEIVKDKNLTFIGPTTGIIGIYHGAWWYYLLTIPYFVFKGWPMGFYWFIFFIALIFNLIFFYFLKKEYNEFISLFFLAIIAVSSYFVSLSISVSNNVIVPNLLIILIMLTYYYLKKEKIKYINFYFAIPVILGLILEFEVAFGLFLIPIYLIIIFIFTKNKKNFINLKNIFYVLSSFIIASLPRILFEVKNNFMQTKTFINFLIQPKLHNPRPFQIIFFERINGFWHYFKSIFYDYNQTIALFFLILIILGILIFKKNKTINFKIINFNLAVIFLLFFFSLIYKDNFWFNYFEGIQYLMLFIMVNIIYLFNKNKNLKFFSYILIVFFITFSILSFIKDITSIKKNYFTGFKPINYSIDYIFQSSKNQNICLKIYTPPVIPYTYDYLISYYTKKNNYLINKENYVNNQCWYIIEEDPYQFRKNEWIKNNIDKNTIIKNKKILNNKTIIELREKKSI